MLHNFLVRASLLCVLLLLTVICASALPGDLYLTFGNGGKVTTSFLSNFRNYAEAIVIQPDGKIVVAGITGNSVSSEHIDFAVVRCNSDGTLDNS